MKEPAGLTRAGRPSILLAETGEEMQSAFVKVLEPFYDVAVVPIGKPWLEVARAIQPQAIVLHYRLLLPIEKLAAGLAPVIVVSLHQERQFPEDCLRRNAKGYVWKGSAPATIHEAIRSVLAGKTFVDPHVQ